MKSIERERENQLGVRERKNKVGQNLLFTLSKQSNSNSPFPHYTFEMSSSGQLLSDVTTFFVIYSIQQF